MCFFIQTNLGTECLVQITQNSVMIGGCAQQIYQEFV